MRAKFTPSVIRDISVHFHMDGWGRTLSLPPIRTPYQLIALGSIYSSLSQYFYPGGTLEIIFRSQGTPA